MWYPFVFSNRLLFRISRHVVFWLLFSAWYLQLCVGLPSSHLDYLNHTGLLASRLPVCILTTYITLYYLIPRFLLRKKYKQFLLAMVVLSFIYPLLFAHPFIFGSEGKDMTTLLKVKVSLWDGWGLAMAVSGFATVIKLVKTYYLENSQNERLKQEKTNYELHLLKSQLNSRFLFDILKKIQQHVRNQSPESSRLILKLSDILSYILYENDERSVPLGKEIEIIDGYLKLEKEIYGSSIDIQVTQQGEIGEKRIQAMVLLPLVESCFEQSSFVPRKDASISIDFAVKGLILMVTMEINNLRNFSNEVFQKSVRIKNLKHMLSKHYTGRHQFGITEENDNYVVQLKIGL
jgi:two-component system, LytTR family, sensor kinase